ncbi:MAG: Fe2+-enterobactin ABC transporter substrate-binding protein [Thermoactinospora sp.]|nr:Fe2+-enterobactin ABC transporter substrate-binding protein [Thermoactinospora sp.]
MFRAVLAALVAAAVLTACGSAQETAGASGETRAVQHDAGTTQVPVSPKRIVSMSVTMTGHLLAVEAPVVASQATPPSPMTDAGGFFKQWGQVASQRGVQVLYQGFEANLEKVVEFKPDLIVGSASGQDSSAKIFDQLKAIAPTVLYRYDNTTWQDLTTRLGQALGLEANASKAIAAYDQKVAQVKSAVQTGGKDAVVVRDNNTDIPVFTAESAQGALLTSLGFTLHAIDPSLAAASSKEGGNRKDIVNVAQENVVKAFGDSSVFFAGHSAEQISATQAKPLWKDLPAVADKRVYDLGLEAFRIDYFSASAILDRIQQQLA